MRIELNHRGKNYFTDLEKGISLASPLGIAAVEFKAWSVPDVKLTPVTAGNWVGSVRQGASVNFYNISLNPHGNGTHTEGRGHITHEHHSLNQSLKSFHFICRVVRVNPLNINGDQVVSLESLQSKWQPEGESALILATGKYKPGYDFSGTNPPYVQPELMQWLRNNGVSHFLTDLPSVDKEDDGGKLSAHNSFWPMDDVFSETASISEMLAIPFNLTEGLYLLNLQIPAFENDAAPSRPVIYPLQMKI